jgi:hypothetical protein
MGEEVSFMRFLIFMEKFDILLCKKYNISKKIGIKDGI